MKTDFTFHYPTDTTDLICQAHREGDDIELDHVWLGDTDILPVLNFEADRHYSWLLNRIYEAAEEERKAGWRRSLTA